MAEWRRHDLLEDHFRRHGAEVGTRTVAEYDRSARETIHVGTRFEFRRTGELRVGYYHRRTRRLVILNATEEYILSHSRESENHVGTLRSSTYRR